MIFSTRTAAPLLGMATLAALGLAAKPAAAQTTISFDNYSFNETETSRGFSNLGTSYSNQGFTFTSGVNSDNLFVDLGNGTYGDGKNSINDGRPNGTIRLTSATSGQTFSLNSVDIGSLYNNSNPGGYAANTVLTGTLLGGGMVSDMVTYDGQAQTFNFTNLTDLTSLTLTGQPSVTSTTRNSIPLFDNFVLNAPAAPTPSAAPEPSAVAGLGMTVLGLGGLVLRARKRKMVQSAS